MKKILLILLCLPMIGLGQGWEQTFGEATSDNNANNPPSDIGYCVQQTNDGGFIITGQTKSSGNSDIYVIKTDENGIVIWEKYFDQEISDGGRSIQQTSDGGYIICGTTSTGGSPDIILLKINGNGDEQWRKIIGSSSLNSSYKGYCVQQTNDGGYVLSGKNSSRLYIVKTDEFGDQLWTRTFNDGGLGRSVEQTNDGGFILTGITLGSTSSGSPYDVYLLKTDGEGIEEWSNTFQGYFQSAGYSSKQTSDYGYIITGYTKSEEGNRVVFLIKTFENGMLDWTKTFGGSDNDGGYCVQQTSDGGYIMTGYTDQTEKFGDGQYGGGDLYLIKTDNDGDEQWSQTFGGFGQDVGYYVQQTTDGGYIITGYTGPYSFTNFAKVYLIKTNSFGNITSTFEIPLPNANRKLDKTIDILGKETKPQPNTPLIEIYDDGTVEKKIIIE